MVHPIVNWNQPSTEALLASFNEQDAQHGITEMYVARMAAKKALLRNQLDKWTAEDADLVQTMLADTVFNRMIGEIEDAEDANCPLVPWERKEHATLGLRLAIGKVDVHSGRVIKYSDITVRKQNRRTKEWETSQHFTVDQERWLRDQVVVLNDRQLDLRHPA